MLLGWSIVASGGAALCKWQGGAGKYIDAFKFAKHCFPLTTQGPSLASWTLRKAEQVGNTRFHNERGLFFPQLALVMFLTSHKRKLVKGLCVGIGVLGAVLRAAVMVLGARCCCSRCCF